MRCSSLHSFNCGKRDSIPFTSNPFLTLAINTISFVFRLRALYSSNHSLCFSHSVCFIPFPLLLQQLIIINHNKIAHYCFTGECILILQHITPFCQQTNHLSFIVEINSIYTTILLTAIQQILHSSPASASSSPRSITYSYSVNFFTFSISNNNPNRYIVRSFFTLIMKQSNSNAP